MRFWSLTFNSFLALFTAYTKLSLLSFNSLTVSYKTLFSFSVPLNYDS
nr:MAG TPA: hypothetical protein [Caudoviricetes sp.]